MTAALPQAFVAEMAEQLGAELPAFLRSYEEPARRGLRLNPLKPLPDTAMAEGLGARVPWAADGFLLSAESRAGAHPLHEAGAWYLQEPCAMLPAEVLAVRPGETVLDLCSAPGGKATQLGAAMRGQGLLVCNEPVPSRAQVLSRNIERMGIVNALVVSAMPDVLAARWAEGFDAVLCDAPCSGEGMFRRVPESRAEWTPASPAGCAARQAEILDAAARLVRPGGRLVYATCTFNRTENADTVAAFLRRHPDYRAEAFSLPGIDAPEGQFTCWPHRLPGEGQFCALMRRDGEGVSALRRNPLPAPDRTAREALAAAVPDAPRETGVFAGTLVAAPALPDLTGLRVLRCGLHLGAMKGKIFQPDHAWCVSALPPALPRVPLTEEAAYRYLAGEALPAETGSGLVLPAFGGLALGLGKISGGLMKNHYPKGLRRALRHN